MERFPWLRRLFPIVLILVLIGCSQVIDDYLQYILNLVLIYVILGIGLNLLLGFAGQFAFAHAALMGIGAYASALLTTRLGVSFWISLPLAGIISAVIGAVGALPAMRMRRVYLALVTLAFAQLVIWVLINWNSVTLGTDGVDVRAPYLFSWRMKGDRATFYIILPVTVLMYWLARRVLESHIGRALITIRENEIVARSNGINVARTKTLVFALSAFYAGIGGALYGLTLGFIVPDSFGLSQLTLHFSIVVLGGMLSLYGAVIGAVVLTILPEFLRGVQALQEIIYGLVLMVVILVMPQGIAGPLKRFGILPREILARNRRRLGRPGPGSS